ncbi:MAG: DinB family protein [Pseudomonadota bacterium]
MIDRGYCVTMARYNAWQNAQIDEALVDWSPEDLTRNRGAFFGSMLGTLNHLLWGDVIWMSRFDGGPAPDGGIPDSPDRHTTLAGWRDERYATDARIRTWANALDDTALQSDLTWFSGALNKEVRRPRALCITHMFNHQTHHRGQVHAMLTAAGSAAPVSDLFVMPEEA